MESPSPIQQAGYEDSLARAIVNTIRIPLLVLSGRLLVIVASPSFCKTFGVSPEEIIGRHLSVLGNGQWDIPNLLDLLREVIPLHTTLEEFDVEHDFPKIGPRVMRLNAREIEHKDADNTELLLLAFEDITEGCGSQRVKDDLLLQSDARLAEMQHRINNSLQIIANILLIKAKTVGSEELRRHLHDAHERVISVVTVQNHLQAVDLGDRIEIGTYLTRLCASLGESMFREQHAFAIEVGANGQVVTSGEAVRLGLITTELVINAVKHAFLEREKGRILVRYAAAEGRWTLSVEDDGCGFPAQRNERAGGLGTSIVEVLARQMGGQVKVSSSSRGTSVIILGEHVRAGAR
jgi:chemotaxis protein methyltransferase CheR